MFYKWKKLFEKHETNYMHSPALTYYHELTDLQERTDAVHKVADSWFHMIELGIANLIMPSISEPIPLSEEADRIIDIYDDFTSDEVINHFTYWRDKGIADTGKEVDASTRFNELIGTSRRAFAQDIWRVIKRQFPEEE